MHTHRTSHYLEHLMLMPLTVATLLDCIDWNWIGIAGVEAYGGSTWPSEALWVRDEL